MMKSMSIAGQITAEDRYGRRMAARLDSAAQSLPHDITERLRVAHLQALEKYRQLQKAPAIAALPMRGGALALVAGSDDERSFWPRLVSLVPLVALVAGLVAIQTLSSEQIAEDLAEIDSAILTDDLPPDAYADPGFAQFLKTRLSALQQDARP